MSERGLEAVAINEITEAADLGFGTFYNYFDSKEAIHEALVDELFESFGAALDQIAEQVDDPAEVIAASVRYTLRRASDEPLWGRFLVRVGFWSPVLDRGLAPRVIRDLHTGVASGRFQADDFPMTVIAVRGVVLSAVDASTASPQKGTRDQGFAELVGAESKSIPERTAAVLLRLLGLEPQEAEEVVSRPLPTIELPPNPLEPPA
jgi:AcrR family transcriptional regulator